MDSLADPSQREFHKMVSIGLSIVDSKGNPHATSLYHRRPSHNHPRRVGQVAREHLIKVCDEMEDLHDVAEVLSWLGVQPHQGVLMEEAVLNVQIGPSFPLD